MHGKYLKIYIEKKNRIQNSAERAEISAFRQDREI